MPLAGLWGNRGSTGGRIPARWSAGGEGKQGEDQEEVAANLWVAVGRARWWSEPAAPQRGAAGGVSAPARWRSGEGWRAWPVLGACWGGGLRGWVVDLEGGKPELGAPWTGE